MKKVIYILATVLFTACSSEKAFDAQGTFEATEVIISSEATGSILSFNAEEGSEVNIGKTIVEIDSTQLNLQRKQLNAQLNALINSKPDIKAQISSIKEQIAKQQVELQRVENMLKDGAATPKQKDDLEAQIRILESQLSATLSTLDKNTSTINNNALALEAQLSALNDRISKCKVTSPINGTVLVKYAQTGELATTGKPLFKVADLNKIYLRAYFTSDQLAKIKLGDKVKVIANFGAEERYDYQGTIAWIASECEFTPKTIQTNESRANLVYAVKIAVVNDGKLKIGLAGEVVL